MSARSIPHKGTIPGWDATQGRVEEYTDGKEQKDQVKANPELGLPEQ